MDLELHDFLAQVEALVPISVVVRLLEPALLYDSHDGTVLFADLLDVVELALAFEVLLVPLFGLQNVLLSRV